VIAIFYLCTNWFEYRRGFLLITRRRIGHDGWYLHWVGGVPVDIVEPVGRRCRFRDNVNHQQEKVDDQLGRHDVCMYIYMYVCKI